MDGVTRSLACWIVAALALLTGVATAQDCTLCAEDHTVACPTCDGRGTVVVDCYRCAAKGKTPCSTCPHARTYFGRKVEHEPGTIVCPNRYCHGGQMRWQGGKTDKCKFCGGKGRFRCPDCKGKKEAECVVCDGKGQRARTCWTCHGAARLPCPLCQLKPTAAECAVCSASAKVACDLCKDTESSSTRRCYTCGGDGNTACASCLGLGKTPCSACGASGVKRSVVGLGGVPLGGSAGVKRCDVCKGTGAGRCPSCKNGKLDCAECKRGRVPAFCEGCSDRAWLPCDDCLSGGYARWLVLGEMLLESGHRAAAARYLSVAREVAAEMAGPRNLPEKEVEMIVELRARINEVAEAARLLEALGERTERLRLRPEHLQPWFPMDARERYWSGGTSDDVLLPWRDASWLQRHRERVVARIDVLLEKAR